MPHLISRLTVYTALFSKAISTSHCTATAAAAAAVAAAKTRAKSLRTRMNDSCVLPCTMMMTVFLNVKNKNNGPPPPLQPTKLPHDQRLCKGFPF